MLQKLDKTVLSNDDIDLDDIDTDVVTNLVIIWTLIL